MFDIGQMLLLLYYKRAQGDMRFLHHLKEGRRKILQSDCSTTAFFFFFGGLNPSSYQCIHLLPAVMAANQLPHLSYFEKCVGAVGSEECRGVCVCKVYFPISVVFLP